MKTFAKIAFTPAVQMLQSADGSRAAYARMQAESEPGEGLRARETEFIAARDSFYMATVSETGWPYVQHRGGPRGLPAGAHADAVALADFRGNRQYVSVGNLARRPRLAVLHGLPQPAAPEAARPLARSRPSATPTRSSCAGRPARTTRRASSARW